MATDAFNIGLACMLETLEGEFAIEDVTLYPIDFSTVGASLSQSLIPYPASTIYLEDLIQASLDDDYEPRGIDDSLFDSFIFWDTIHPTKAVH